MQESFKGKSLMSTHSRPNSQQPRVEREGGGSREAMAGGSVTDTLSDVFDGVESDVRGL